LLNYFPIKIGLFTPTQRGYQQSSDFLEELDWSQRLNSVEYLQLREYNVSNPQCLDCVVEKIECFPNLKGVSVSFVDQRTFKTLCPEDVLSSNDLQMWNNHVSSLQDEDIEILTNEQLCVHKASLANNTWDIKFL